MCVQGTQNAWGLWREKEASFLAFMGGVQASTSGGGGPSQTVEGVKFMGKVRLIAGETVAPRSNVSSHAKRKHGISL